MAAEEALHTAWDGQGSGSRALAGLVRRLQDGDESALEPFIARTHKAAWRLAVSMLRDPHLAEDCLQDAYLAVCRGVHGLRDPEAAHTWLLRIVTNRCRRLLRQRRPSSLDELAETGLEPAAPDPTARTDTRLGVRSALTRLGHQDREVLALREVMQLTYDEIAATLKVPLGTVRSRLSKARARLAALLLAREEESR